MAETKIQITIEAIDKAKGALTDLADSLKNIQTKTKEVGDAGSQMGGILGSLKDSWWMLSVGINQALELFNKVIEIPQKMAAWGEMGAQIERVEQAFNAVADAADVSSQKLIASLQKASRGMMDDTQIIQRAGRMIQEGINPEKMVELMDLLAKQAPVVGDTLPEAWDKFSDAIARGNVRAVRAYVGLVDLDHEYDRYAQSIGTVSRNLTESARMAAAFDAVIEKLRDRTRGLTDAHEGYASSIARSKANIKNSWDEIYKSFKPFADAFYEFQATWMKFLESMTKPNWFSDFLNKRLGVPEIQKYLEQTGKYLEQPMEIFGGLPQAGGKAGQKPSDIRKMTIEEQRQMESMVTSSMLDEFAKRRRQAEADHDYLIKLWASSAEGKLNADKWYANESTKIDRDEKAFRIQEEIKTLAAEGKPKAAALKQQELEILMLKDASLAVQVQSRQQAESEKQNADIRMAINKEVVASELDGFKKMREQADIELEENVRKFQEEVDGKQKAYEIFNNRIEAIRRAIAASVLQEHIKTMNAQGEELKAKLLGFELEKIQAKDASDLSEINGRQDVELAQFFANKTKELDKEVIASKLDAFEKANAQIEIHYQENLKKYKDLPEGQTKADEIRKNEKEALNREILSSELADQVRIMRAKGQEGEAIKLENQIEELGIKDKSQLALTGLRQEFEYAKTVADKKLELQSKVTDSMLDDGERQRRQIDDITAELEKKYGSLPGAIIMIGEIRANATEKLNRQTLAAIKGEEAATLEAEGKKRAAGQATHEQTLLLITDKDLVERTSRRLTAQEARRDREEYLDTQKKLIAAELDDFKREHNQIILTYVEEKDAAKESAEGQVAAEKKRDADLERLRKKVEISRLQQSVLTLEAQGKEREALLVTFEIEQLGARSAMELTAMKARQDAQLEKLDFDQKMKYQKDFTQAEIEGWDLHDRYMADQRMQIDGIQEKEKSFLDWHRQYISANLEIWGELFKKSSEFASEYLSFREKELETDVEYLRKTVGDSLALEKYKAEKTKELQIEAGAMPAAQSFVEGHRLQAREWQNLSQQMVDMARACAQSMQQAFSDGFFDILTLQFNKLGDGLTNFLQGVARALSNYLSYQVSAPIIAGLQGWLGGSSGTVPVVHSGSHGVIRFIPMLHSGLASDEFPAILQTGEQVLSRREVAAGLGSMQPTQVIINVQNRTGAPVKAKDLGTRVQGKNMVRTIVLELAESDMTVRSAFGLNR
jgi:hypothetical protein